MEKNTKDLIVQLKSVRKEKGISLQDIVDQCAAAGNYVSLSSVRRVFAENSENAGFRYDTTIQPIAKVVLGFDDAEKTEETADAESRTLTEIDAENNAFKTIISLKNKMLEAKDQEIERLMESTKNQVDTIKAQLNTRENNIEYLKKQVSDQRKFLVISRAIVFLLFMLIIFALVIDKINPDIGFFWK